MPGSWSTLVVPVAAAEPVVGRWRERLDRWARVPAHVTVLGPFLPVERVDASVVLRLGAVAAGIAPFAVPFGEVERLDGAVCLLPSRVDDLRRLAAELIREWPEAEGAARERRFHLTVARTDDTAELERIEAAVRPALPIVGRAEKLLLFTRLAGSDPELAGRFRLGGTPRG